MLHKGRQTQPMTFSRRLHARVHVPTGLHGDHGEAQRSAIPGCFGRACRRKFKWFGPRKLSICRVTMYIMHQ